MMKGYVRVQAGAFRLVRRLRDGQKGLTMIEYMAAAAFIVLILVLAAVAMQGELRDWVTTTIRRIIRGQ